GPEPRVFVVGPLSEGRVLIHATPSGKASPGRPPALSVLLSTMRVLPNPVAVLPGSGFWSTENAGGVVFNWLRDSGIIDIFAPGTYTGRGWLTFVARSLGQQRTLTAQDGQVTGHAVVSSIPSR